MACVEEKTAMWYSKWTQRKWTGRQRLCAGVPIIAFVAILNDTHYVVVVGYDADYLYLADSLAAEGAPYNRKLPIEEFERVWKTKTLLPDNIYIVINEK